MKLIAHRGNINGPNPSQENNPNYIDQAIQSGFDVEIDLRYVNKEFYLGHDDSQYQVSIEWLVEKNNFLWIHCKDFNSLEILSNISVDFNYFWHERDKYALTSQGYIWSYPGQQYSSKTVVVMPEKNDSLKFYSTEENMHMSNYECFAICSDFVNKIK
ncbi:MAG: hypothetical protein RIT11_953 [Pseudomonadota bacterium]|jgi:hypothetical protein